MSKELTEQWRKGTLPRGAYYVNRLNEIRVYLVTYEDDKNTHEIYEVLAPVPTYYQFVDLTEKVLDLEQDNKYLKSGIETRDKQIEQLVNQLEIASKALKKINRKYRFTVAQDVVYKALKEMKGLK